MVNPILTRRRLDDHSMSGNQRLLQLHMRLLLRQPTRTVARHLVLSMSPLPHHDHAIPMLLLLRIRMHLVHHLPQLEECRQPEDIRLREVTQRQLHLIPTLHLHMIEHLLPERPRGMQQLRSMLHGDQPVQAEDLPVDTLMPSLLHHERLLLPGDMLDMSNAVPRHQLGTGQRKLPAIFMVRTAAPELLLVVVLLNTQAHLTAHKDIRCRQRLRLCHILLCHYSKQKKAAALETEKYYRLL